MGPKNTWQSCEWVLILIIGGRGRHMGGVCFKNTMWSHVLFSPPLFLSTFVLHFVRGSASSILPFFFSFLFFFLWTYPQVILDRQSCLMPTHFQLRLGISMDLLPDSFPPAACALLYILPALNAFSMAHAALPDKSSHALLFCAWRSPPRSYRNNPGLGKQKLVGLASLALACLWGFKII